MTQPDHDEVDHNLRQLDHNEVDHKLRQLDYHEARPNEPVQNQAARP